MTPGHDLASNVGGPPGPASEVVVPMQRTFAMRVYAAAYGVLTLSFAFIFIVVLLPDIGKSPDIAALAPILAAFLALFAVCAALAAFLPSAPRRRRFWIVGLLPAVAFLLMNAPYLPYSATHPADAAFPGTVPLILWSVVVVIAGITAYREIGASASAAATSGPGLPATSVVSPVRARAVWAVAIVAGISLGASVTGYLAASQGGGGDAALTGAPTTTGTLVAQGTKYLTTSYAMSSKDVLGLFVENKDSFAHSFDVDALGIHVQVPAGATVAIAVKPTATGSIQFYCAIPGHKEAGMAGTIVVQ
jgi:uncharacterized cupredoxin-like copper-binding protein